MSYHTAEIRETLPGIFSLALFDGSAPVMSTYNTDKAKLEALAEWWGTQV